MTRIPLEQVAPDQRDAIRAFRDGGARSFQDAGSMAQARVNYVASARANGVERIELAVVDDVVLGAGDEAFTVRVYDAVPGGGASVGASDEGEIAASDVPGAASDDAGSSSPRPVVAFFHAGGWVIGNLETHDTLCRWLAHRLGLPVVAVDYRLGPEHRFPAAHLDAVRAVEWLRDVAHERGWDASRIITIGDSAGGGLATMLASQPSAAVPGATVVAQALLYPVLDLSGESASYGRVTASDEIPLSAETMRWFAENYLADDPQAAAEQARDPRVSPLLFARDAAVVDAGRAAAAQPPAFILSLGLDPLSDEIVEYAGLLALVGTEVEHVHLPRHAHGIFTSAGKVRAGVEQLERAAAFIERQLAALDAEAPEEAAATASAPDSDAPVLG